MFSLIQISTKGILQLSGTGLPALGPIRADGNPFRLNTPPTFAAAVADRLKNSSSSPLHPLTGQSKTMAR